MVGVGWQLRCDRRRYQWVRYRETGATIKYTLPVAIRIDGDHMGYTYQVANHPLL